MEIPTAVPAQGADVEIIAHRGSWLVPAEHNTRVAFERAWSFGAGVETDLRDLDGEVVVSHDMPRTCPEPMTLTDLLDAWDAAGRRGRLALNIKADGLATPVAAALEARGASDRAFVFDMSVPDQLAHARTSTPVYARWSELEPPVLTGGEAGLWLDAFTDDGWWDADAVRGHLADGRRVVLVSPELHGRSPLAVWERLRSEGLGALPGFGLCTDHVLEARDHFGLSAADREEVFA